ncbi:MAG: hypothetical protein Q8M16_12480 [Pirellulaceae bacterium]|nr:hypothetical protein [Pirellulaceae bacterium]
MKIRDLDADQAEAERLQKVLSAYKIVDYTLPVVYGLNRAVTEKKTVEEWELALRQLLTIQVYIRPGCSKCVKAKEYLPQGIVVWYGVPQLFPDDRNIVRSDDPHLDPPSIDR